jgi:DNA-binding beta-propeller fold protein YncE
MRNLLLITLSIAWWLVLGLANLPGDSRADSGPPFVRMWGSYGVDPGQFRAPFGVAIAPSGSVYITDQYNHRVQIFSSTGTFVGQFGSFGSGPGQFNFPYGIAAAPDGSVFVVDRENKRIEKFSADGAFLLEWSLDPFSYPRGIAVEPDGNILVGNHGEVSRYSQSGQFIASLGGFSGVEGIVVEPDGEIWVTQLGIYVTKHSSNGALLQTLSVNSGSVALALDSTGNLYVVERSTNSVVIYSPLGQRLVTWGSHGTGPGEFMEPCGIAISPDGFIYVADTANHRIQVFGDTFVPVAETSWGRVKDAYRR